MNGPGRTPIRLRRARRAFFGTRSRVRSFLVSAGAVRVSPRYRRLRWLSGIILILFCLEVVSGILLSLHYDADPGNAYRAMRFLLSQVPGGWLVRSIHHWSSELLLTAVILHLAHVYFRRAYVHPREYGWVIGGLLLLVVLTFRFTGRLLPWDTYGYAVTRHGLDLIETVPLFGTLMATWLRGGEDMGPNTLARFFTTHTLILPWVFVLLAGLHLHLVRLHGLKGGAK